jgi:hypothetical protein
LGQYQIIQNGVLNEETFDTVYGGSRIDRMCGSEELFFGKDL